MELVLSFVIFCVAIGSTVYYISQYLVRWRQRREQERMLVREIERFLQSKKRT